jgi:hypothetical protein
MTQHQDDAEVLAALMGEHGRVNPVISNANNRIEPNPDFINDETRIEPNPVVRNAHTPIELNPVMGNDHIRIDPASSSPSWWTRLLAAFVGRVVDDPPRSAKFARLAIESVVPGSAHNATDQRRSPQHRHHRGCEASQHPGTEAPMSTRSTITPFDVAPTRVEGSGRRRPDRPSTPFDKPTRTNRLAEIVIADADHQLAAARARVIRARLVELREIARRHGLMTPAGLRAWDQASGIDRGGARKR